MLDSTASSIDRLPHIPEKKLDASGNLAPADFTAPTPFIVRGLVRDWPLVQAGLESSDAARSYLLKFYNEQPVFVTSGPPEIRGRIFYNDDMSLNINVQKAGLRDVFKQIAASEEEAEQLCLYVASAAAESYFPGMLQENPVDLGGQSAHGWIWMGTRTQIAPHNERNHWRDILDYYVFRPDERTTAHIPEDKRGFLGPMTPKMAQAIRGKLKEYFKR
ncbi:cupin-like domain-containing protein [Congregibacter sp.]|uniref:cupin-like domain-containing protein n=1 Tax=Congregibacter sp. TaxID=2744308 RepID=UPI003F6A9AA3